MSIPFTQYLLPDGQRRDESIDRPEDIEALARQFIDAGGRYECEILTTGEVSLTAVIDTGDGEEDAEIEICQNAPGVGAAVDRLVSASVRHIKAEATS